MLNDLLEQVRLHVVTEAPTPHNNYFFSALAADSAVCVDLHYIYDSRNVPERPWKSLSEEIGANTTRVGISKWFDIKLMRLAVSKNPGVFFVIGWNYPSLYMLITLIGLRRAPLLMWFDTPKPSGGLGWDIKSIAKRFLIRMINRCPGAIFVTGKLAKQEYLALGIKSEQLQILPFFAPRAVGDRCHARTEYLTSTDQIMILAAGRLILSKGFDIFLAALANLRRDKIGGWRAVLVGSGPEQDALKILAERYGLDGSLYFVPWVEQDAFEELILACDIFVAPAHFDPFPTTVISAMQVGKAVVATYGVGSAVEFVESGVSGICVSPGDPDSMSDALASLISDPGYLRMMGRQAATALLKWPVNRGVEIIRTEIKKNFVGGETVSD